MTDTSVLPIEDVNVSHTDAPVSIVIEEVEAKSCLGLTAPYDQLRLDFLEEILEINLLSCQFKEVDDFIGNNDIVFLNSRTMFYFENC